MTPPTTEFGSNEAVPTRREFLVRVTSGIVGIGAALSLVGCADGDEEVQNDGRQSSTASSGGAIDADGEIGSATTLATPPPTVPVPSGGDPFVTPDVVASADGVLNTTLTAAATMVPWASGERFALSYNDGVTGPTLVAKPGDVIKVRLVNDLDEPTNLHTHGLHVSPDGKSDNPFRVVEPGSSFDYEFEIPLDHPTGTFWYHPHQHQMVAQQVHGGLCGAIVIVDPDDEFAGSAEHGGALAGTERLLVVTDPTIASDADGLIVTESQRQMGREGHVILVNGQLSPADVVAPDSVEHWRIVNACASRYHDLTVRVDGRSVEFEMIGTDQGRLPTPVSQDWHRLTPGQRVEIRVPIPADAASLELVSTPVNRGSAHISMMDGEPTATGPADAGPTVLLHLDVGPAATSTDSTSTDSTSTDSTSPGSTGANSTSAPAETTVADSESTNSSAPSEETIPSVAESEDLANLVVARREIQLGAMAMGPDEFSIDGKNFDPDRIDIEVAAGTVEEWIINNGSMMNHPFHLHVWPFQVVARSGTDPDPGWRDVVDVLPGETVTIRVDFRSMTGKTVYHCHILDHEDFGMMGIVNVA